MNNSDRNRLVRLQNILESVPFSASLLLYMTPTYPPEGCEIVARVYPGGRIELWRKQK